MKLSCNSLRSFAIALVLAVSTTGCFAQVDAGADAIEALPGSETLSADDADEGNLDWSTVSPDEEPADGTDSDEPPPPPPPNPGGVCTGSSCTPV